VTKGAKFEYHLFQMKAVPIDASTLSVAIAELNAFADNGWHVVATWPSMQGWDRVLVLEREK
jgi:hypothetical protein